MNMFIGYFMIILCQLSVMCMIIYYEATSPKFKIQPAKQLDIIVTRFLASLMMHLSVEPEMR